MRLKSAHVLFLSFASVSYLFNCLFVKIIEYVHWTIIPVE